MFKMFTLAAAISLGFAYYAQAQGFSPIAYVPNLWPEDGAVDKAAAVTRDAPGATAATAAPQQPERQDR